MIVCVCVRTTTQEEKTTHYFSCAETQEEAKEALKTLEATRTKCNVK
jgi:hypothetical protein